MAALTTNDIHNVLVIGPQGHGKTALVDAMLYAGGAVSERAGTSDFTPEERAHGHSIYASVVHADYAGKRINVIDAPGAPDFVAQAMACLPAVETVFCVVSAGSSVDASTRRLFELAKELGLTRAVIVNRIDRPEANCAATLDALRASFGAEVMPVNLPAEGGTRVVDCLLDHRGESDLGGVKDHHTRILDQVVELDDALMEKYLGGEEPNFEALHDPFERAMRTAHLIPVCFTDARTGVGVKELLDVLVRYAPSPLEGNLRPFVAETAGETTPFTYANTEEGPLLAHVFKVTSDPFAGKLAYFRVFQGRATAGSQVIVGASRRTVKLGHVFQLQGRQHPEVEAVIAGDIGAVAKLDELRIGDVLHDDHALDAVHHKAIRYPDALYALALEPTTRADAGKVVSALERLAEEDPSLKVKYDGETHELLLQGVGELHLRVALERLKARGLEVTTKVPKVAYRETIEASAPGHYRHKKQTGGAGQFAEVFLRVEPLPRGAGFEFASEVVGGAIPAQFVWAVEKGVRDAMEEGVISGHPLQDVRCVVYDGKTHSVDSKEVAFRTAGRFAFREAVKAAKPRVLEPLVEVEVSVPAQLVGAITGDLSSRRGRILGTEVAADGSSVIQAQAPLVEVLRYGDHVKGLTGGRGSFSMSFSHYDPVPAAVQQELTAAYRPTEEA